MFNSKNNQSVTLKNEMSYRDRFATAVIDVKKFEIVDITENDRCSFLHREYKFILINDNIKFVLSDDLVGLIQQGKFRFWYCCKDERYVKIMMIEHELNYL